MKLLPTLIGLTVISVNVSAEVLLEEPFVCGVKIHDMYYRSGDVYMLCQPNSQFRTVSITMSIFSLSQT